jgi:small-conductance mechanosensitive channel
MKNTKGFIIIALMAVAHYINAADDVAVKSIDANATREAIGMTAITLVPVLVLIIVLIVLGFATQKIPGLKG